ncbi:MAG TPA: YncE family protein [Acidobacteriota bacterium]|nr:YncE family protein [Acidobacteriota bacterium]
MIAVAVSIFVTAPAISAQGGIVGAAVVGQSPVAVAINPVVGQAFVLNKGSKDVSVLDLKSRSVVTKYLVGGLPEGIAVNPQTNAVVVVSLDSTATVIDHAAGRIAGVIPVGKAPSRVAIDTEKNAALITNFNGSNMVVLDLAGRRVVRTIELKSGPLGIAVLEGKRRALVACQYDMEILQVDLDKGEVDQSLVVGRYLNDVAVDPVTGNGVVGNPSSNGMLSIYDSGANRVVSTVPVGHGPLSVAVYPRRNVALAAEFDSGSLSIVDMATGTVIRSVKVGKGPRGIAVNPQTGIAVVVNMLEDKAVFLDLDTLLGTPAANP